MTAPDPRYYRPGDRLRIHWVDTKAKGAPRARTSAGTVPFRLPADAFALERGDGIEREIERIAVEVVIDVDLLHAAGD